MSISHVAAPSCRDDLASNRCQLRADPSDGASARSCAPFSAKGDSELRVLHAPADCSPRRVAPSSGWSLAAGGSRGGGRSRGAPARLSLAECSRQSCPSLLDAAGSTPERLVLPGMSFPPHRNNALSLLDLLDGLIDTRNKVVGQSA